MKQNVDIPVGGGLQDFRPGQSSSSVAHSPAAWLSTEDEAIQGGFSHFPQNKKSATVPPHSGSALPPHSSPWTPAAYDASMMLEEEEEKSEDEPVEYVQHDGRWWRVRVGPSSPAVLLVAGRCRWVSGWPYHLAASMAHRQRARVTMCYDGASGLVLGSTVDTCSSVDVLWRCLFQFIVRVVDTALMYRDRHAQCQTVQGRRLPCHGAEDVQQTTEISQLQSIDTVVVVVVQVVQFGYTP